MKSGTKLGDSKMGICPSSARARFCRESAPPAVRDGVVDVASHSGLTRECHALFYGGAQARIFAKERTCARACRESAPPSVCDGDVRRSRIAIDVGAKLTTLQQRVASSRVPWLLLAGLGELRVMRAVSRRERRCLKCQHLSDTGQSRLSAPPRGRTSAPQVTDVLSRSGRSSYGQRWHVSPRGTTTPRKVHRWQMG